MKRPRIITAIIKVSSNQNKRNQRAIKLIINQEENRNFTNPNNNLRTIDA